MKIKRFRCQIVILGAALVCGAGTLRADLLDGQDDPVTIPLAMQVTGGGPYASYFSFVMSVNGTYVANYTGYLPNFSVPPVYAQITPEVPFSVVITASGFNGWANSIVVPRGYSLYVDGQVATSLVQGDLNPGDQYTYQFTVVMHRVRSGGLPGEASRIRNNSFYWAVGLGTVQNGSSAGTLMIHQAACPTAATRALIAYTNFCPEIESLSDSIGLRQVVTPQTFVNLWDLANGTGFQIDFYPASAVTIGQVGSNGYYAPSGTPYASYQMTTANSGATFTVTKMTGGTQGYVGATTVTNGNQVNFPGNLRVVTDVDSNYTTNTWVDTTTTADNNGHVSSVIARTYENFPWGQQLIQEVDDPNGKAYTTTYAYNNGSPTEGGYGQLASITYPDGNWVGYSYYNSTNDTLANGTPIAQFGALQTEYHPWLSTVTNPANANASNSRAITYTYAQDFDGQYTLEASRVETINGTTVANRVTTNHLNLTANNLELWERSVADSTGSGQTLTTVSKVYSPYQAANFSVYAGEPYSTQHPDGTMESYAVFSGTYTAASQTLSTTPPGFDLEQIVIHGVTPAVGAGVSGAQPVSSLTDSGSDHTSSTIDQIYVIPNQSTETITYRQGGLVKLQLNYVYTAGGFAFVSSTASTYTPSCKLASTALSNGATSTSAYPQEFKTQDVDATGVTTNYTLDAMQRIVSASRAPGAGYPGTGITLPTSPIVTSYTYDSDNNVTQTQVAGPATALPFSASVTLTTSSTYNPAGKLTSQTDANGLTTFYADSPGNLTQTTTYPGGATKVVTKNLDETPISITGTAQVPTYYAYTLASSGFLSVQQNLGSSTSHNWSVVQTDWLGRKVTVQSPNPTVANPTPTSGSVTTAYTYDSLGQLTEISTPGLAATLYSYTPMGALEMTAVDVNGNGTIDLAGTDRITQTDTAYYEDTNGVWWLKTTQGIYATPGQSFETIVKTTAVQLSGLSSGTAVTTTKDADKNLTTQTTTVSGNVVKTLTASSGLTATAVQYTCNGLPVSQTSVNGNTTTFGYDGVGRQIQVVDPRKGPVDTIYYANSNQVYYTQYDSGSILIQKYTYSSGGLVASQTDEGGNTKDFTYDTMGDVLTNYGTGTTNVTYVYDSFGRMSSQTTWTGTGNVPGVVTFTYNGDLPLLSGKEDALLATVTHSYDSLGRELTRTDSRGVVKTNSYDSATGDLLGCVYTNDPQSTPALAYTYGRTGQLSTVTDGAGERTFTYNYNLSYNTGDLQMASEALPSCFGSSGSTTRNIIYAYAPPAGESYGLLTGVSLSNSSITSNDQSTSYGYDPAGGRLMSVTANGAGFSAYTFAY
jgi:YD repeat-containing protein